MNKGDYCLATKYADGDPMDAWAVGFYASFRDGRHFVVDANGDSLRANGFRHVRKISGKRGAWLLNHSQKIEQSGKRLGYFTRCSMTS